MANEQTGSILWACGGNLGPLCSDDTVFHEGCITATSPVRFLPHLEHRLESRGATWFRHEHLPRISASVSA